MRDLLDAVSGSTALTSSSTASNFGFFREIASLNEGAMDRYMQIFNGLPNQDALKDELTWARRVLKRDDRVMWFLRWVKVRALNELLTSYGPADPENPEAHAKIEKAATKANTEMAKRAGIAPEAVRNMAERTDSSQWRRTMSHLASMFPTVHDMDKLQFAFQTPTEIASELERIEQEFIKEDGRHVAATEDDEDAEKLIDFGDGYAWWNLNRQMCRAEGDAMGHCGNAGSPKTGDRVLSLRRRIMRGSKAVDVPCLTFILDKDDRLGEMKGRGNEKPAAKYHKYITALLLSDYVTGIKGGGYLPQNNFSLNDLPEEDKEEILAKKPELSEVANIDQAIEKLEEYWGGDVDLKQEDENTIVAWEGKLDDLGGGEYLSALKELVDNLDEDDDEDGPITDHTILEMLEAMTDGGLAALAAKFGFPNPPRDYDTHYIYQLYKLIRSSTEARKFVEQSKKTATKLINKESVSNFVKEFIHNFASPRSAESIYPNLTVPDDVLDGYYKITFSKDEIIDLANHLDDDDGNEAAYIYSYNNGGFFDEDNSDEYLSDMARDKKHHSDIWDDPANAAIFTHIINAVKSSGRARRRHLDVGSHKGEANATTAENLAAAVEDALRNGLTARRTKADDDGMDDLFSR